ncbi:MAG TPA: Tol-Pal system beta propeller repeat protein TolB [Steroidobacteraceae bacterium]|nr:Tol-Pal system beta propeller repeat protein TolB [Steroidobacteraceae bacterium]HRX89192.1 Tol-Pal system beta propeller repeat protein TolB [Steroidobacteraceae bacterium]
MRTTGLALIALVMATTSQAQLKIEITSGVTDPIPIAVVQFARGAGTDGLDVAAVVQADLERSGRFKPMARADMLTQPIRSADIDLAAWRQQRNDFVVVGRVTEVGGQSVVEAELVNVLNGQRLFAERFATPSRNMRAVAHRLSDAIYEKILGVRGAFATRIAYVSVDGRPPAQRYQLLVADADGENARVILESKQPLMSPTWSADGEWLAYVSFERRVSAIYVQQVRTGKRSMVSSRAGVNGSPAWSPDGKTLAVTLSGTSGNLDVYLLDLATQSLRRVTTDPAIDTEAVFSPDGKELLFTSDRSGNPQVYRLAIGAQDRPKRVTFSGGYNSRPRVSPDGKLLAMTTLDAGAYRVAVQDLASGTLRVLSRGRQDESPSFAPNGASLIYAGRERGQGVLANVSVDGATSQRLKADAGEVREPVWGPFTTPSQD